MKTQLVSLFLFLISGFPALAQVGINTTAPQALLDIPASNPVAPSVTDGVLIPRVSAFPAVDPDAAQNGMMVFLTTTSGYDAPGFYFWEQATASWVAIGRGATSLDQAYDSTGSGNGRTITADAGAVRVQGADGFQVSGTLNSGALLNITGAGPRMFFYPRKGAFRAGQPLDGGWDDAQVGMHSTAFGLGTVASGTRSTAFGDQTVASGTYSSVFGVFSRAEGSNSFVSGEGSVAESAHETVFGRYNRLNPDLGGSVWDLEDRLFSVGNGMTNTNRSDAFLILKNGLATLPSVNNIMLNTAVGEAIVTKSWVQVNGFGTLNQSYNKGGAGMGRTIAANAGAVEVSGADGFQVGGIFGAGAVMNPIGDHSVMFFYPRKAAFRAGHPNGSEWNNANVGTNSAAFGEQTTASGVHAFAFGNGSSATGITSTAWGAGADATGQFATSFGYQTQAAGFLSTAFGLENTAPSYGETVLGIGATTYSPSPTGPVRFRISNVTDRLFVIGNAIDINNNDVLDASERSNALLVLKNGRVGIGIDTNAGVGGLFELALDQGRKPGSNTWTVPSDERLKTIHGAYAKGLSEVIQLNPVVFSYRNSGGRTFEPEVLKTKFPGFSAQAVREVFPEAIGVDDDGYLNFNIHPILVASVNALKELSEKNDQLEKENKELRKLLTDLAGRVQALETRSE